MPGDYTRLSHDPFEDFIAVRHQGGRVLLDSDLNEESSIRERRDRVASLDTMGRAVVPAETPDGFAIAWAGPSITIGRGRMYVDGHLAENHGLSPREFERHTAEERRTLPVPYEGQPYLPNAAVLAPFPAGPGPHVAYLDVWQRELTHLEDPGMVEKAVGFDTATRLQTVWQVRVLGNVGDVDCATPDDEIPGWTAATAPSAGRLTTAAVGVPAPDDPCIVAASGGYRGIENRLYRVEVHDPGPLGTATFKWSRDNASFGARVRAINAGRDRLTVSRVARDSVLTFAPGDWIEVLDDWQELHGQPGQMARVLTVDPVAETVTLAAALPAGVFDLANPASRNTRVRRWDQQGPVLNAANVVVQNVEANGGVVNVPGAGDLVLEDGIQVVFSAAVVGGSFRTGDYWVFAARTADASIEVLDAAPPRGIHHHYARLAVITPPDDVLDCRVPWPDFGRSCCTRVVFPGESIQAAINSLPAAGGCVCLKAGVHPIGQALVIARSDVTLHGESQGAIVRRTNGATMLIVGGANERIERVQVHDVRFHLDAEGQVPIESGTVLLVQRAADVSLADSTVRVQPPRPLLGGVYVFDSDRVECNRLDVQGAGFGIYATNGSTEIHVSSCRLDYSGEQGAPDGGRVGIWLSDVSGPCRIDGNSVEGYPWGIVLNEDPLGDDPESSASTSLITANLVVRTSPEVPDEEVWAWGIDVAADGCEVRGNRLRYASDRYGGIRMSGRFGEVTDNLLLGFVGQDADGLTPLGILLGSERAAQGASTLGDSCLVARNQVYGDQVGLWLREVERALVADNLFEGGGEAFAAIVATECRDCRLHDNLVRRFAIGLWLGEGASNDLTGNRVVDGGLGLLVQEETGLSVVDGGFEQLEGAGIFGIALHGVTRVAGCRLRHCAHGAGTPIRAAIALSGLDFHLGTEVIVEGCEVLDTGVDPGNGTAFQPATGMFVWATGTAIRGNLVTFTNVAALDPLVESRALHLFGHFVLTFALGQVQIDRGLGGALVTGNRFFGNGFTALVEIARVFLTDVISLGFDRVTFCDNQVVHQAPQADDDRATVSLNGAQMAVANNHVRNSVVPYFSFDLHGNERTTFLGNLTDGPVLGYPPGNQRPAPVGNFNFIG